MNAISRGALVASAAGVALFIFMFLSWFGETGTAAEDAERKRQAAEEFNVDGAPIPDTTQTAWDALGWFGLAILIIALGLGIAFGFVTYTKASVSLPIALSSMTTGAGLFAFLYILYRAINPPGDADFDREAGLWLGMVASAGIVLGGWLGMQEDDTRLS